MSIIRRGYSFQVGCHCSVYRVVRVYVCTYKLPVLQWNFFYNGHFGTKNLWLKYIAEVSLLLKVTMLSHAGLLGQKSFALYYKFQRVLHEQFHCILKILSCVFNALTHTHTNTHTHTHTHTHIQTHTHTITHTYKHTHTHTHTHMYKHLNITTLY